MVSGLTKQIDNKKDFLRSKRSPPENRMRSDLSDGEKELIEGAIRFRFEQVLDSIPADKLIAYASQEGDVQIEKILSTGYKKLIGLIPADKLSAYARQGNDVQIGKILNSRSERAIAMLDFKRLEIYASGSDANMIKVLNSRSNKAIDLIPADKLSAYVSQGGHVQIEKILNSRSERVIAMLDDENLKSYASGSDANISKVLNSRSNKAIDLIPADKLSAYVSQEGNVQIEKILNSHSERAIAMIPDHKLKIYAGGSDANIEKILNSRSDKAINAIPGYKLMAYARKEDANIEKILNSHSERAIAEIPDDILGVYANGGVLNIEVILDSRSSKAIELISDEGLKRYAQGGTNNLEKILNSRSEKAITVIPVDLLKTYARGGDAHIEKILGSRFEKAIAMLRFNELRIYASGGNANIEKVLNSGSSKVIRLIPHDLLASYVDRIRSRFGKIAPFLERQGSSVTSETADLNDEDITTIEKSLNSRDKEVIDLFPLDKLVAYAEGNDDHIEKILSSRFDRVIELIPPNQLAAYARQGNRYMEKILDSRSISAINFISIAQLINYLERDEGSVIDKILNSRSSRVIDLIPEERLKAYARESADNIEKILNSHSDKAINLITDELKVYARESDANIEKILSSRSDKAINLITDELKAYACKSDLHLEKILSSSSEEAIAVIPEDKLKAYAYQGDAHIGKILNSCSPIAINTVPASLLVIYSYGGDANIGRMLNSHSDKAIGWISDDRLKAYAAGNDANIEAILNSRISKAIRLIPMDNLKAYANKENANLEKVLNSQSNMAIATIPINWLRTYASGSDANIDKVLSSRSERVIDLIPAKRLKAYARQGDVNVGKIIASRSDNVIKLIPRASLISYAQTMRQHFERINPYLSGLNKAISKVAIEKCLSDPGASRGYHSRGRQRREVLGEGLCEISWEDVDKFNEEEGKARELKEIKINSEQFLSYLQDPSHSEIKRRQLLQLADKVAITGNAKERVSILVRDQNILRYLNRVSYVSSITMYGMMSKNMLRDFLEEDYQGVAINLGFIVGGEGLSKVARAAVVKGEKLFANGQHLLGRSLKLASPFIARGTSAFIALDLVIQYKSYRQGDPDALVGVVGDGIYLGIEGTELGIEIAEVAGVLEGVSSFTGPIGAGVGVLVFVGTDAYLAVKRVKQEDVLIHLTTKEKWIEGLRAFIGMEPEHYIKDLQEEKQMNNQLYLQGVAFLKNHTNIQRYIFPAAVLEQKCSMKWVKEYDASVMGGFASTIKQVENCKDQWQTEVTSVVMLDEKRKNIKWSRAKPDVAEGNLFCAPVLPVIPLDSQGILSREETYFCDSAIGVEYSAFRTGNITFIALGKGDDTVVGFPYGEHLVMLEDGKKDIELGEGDDTILLDGNRTIGLLNGGGGINTLDLGSFAGEEVVCLTPSTQYNAGFHQLSKDYALLSIDRMDEEPIDEEPIVTSDPLKAYRIQHFLFRTNKQDEVWLPDCSASFIDARGGGAKQGAEDRINIIRNDRSHDCVSNLTLVIRPHTIIYNWGINKNSLYTYVVPQQEGSAVITADPSCSIHQFVFEAAQLDLSHFKWDKRNNYVDIPVYYLKSKENITQFNLRINLPKVSGCGAGQRLLFQLGDNTEIKFLKDKFHVFHRSNHSLEEIIHDYTDIADHFNFSMIVHATLSNESIAIGDASHDVLHNDPYRRSHLIGNGGENIFVVSAGVDDLDGSKLSMPEVVLYDTNAKNLIDTLDLRQIKKQVEKMLGLAIEARVNLIAETSDIAIELFSPSSPSDHWVRVILKDALLTNWYRRLHVILKHVPMKLDNSNLKLKPLSLKFAPKQAIIIIGAEEIEENMTLDIPKRIGRYRFLLWEEDDLMLTNAFDRNATEAECYVLLFREFYDIQTLESFSIKFVDKKLLLKDEIEHIEYAADFSSEYEFYNRMMYAMLFNKKNVTERVKVSSARVGRSHHEVWEERVEEEQVNKGILNTVVSYVLPTLMGVGAMVGLGMGYRNRMRAHFRAAESMPVVNRVVAAMPLLAPRVEAKNEKSDSAEGGRFIGDFSSNLVSNFSILKYLLNAFLPSVVERMNQAECIANTRDVMDSMSPLVLAEQRVLKALKSYDVVNGTNTLEEMMEFQDKLAVRTKLKGTSGAIGKKFSTTFFQSCSVLPSVSNDTRINVSELRKTF